MRVLLAMIFNRRSIMGRCETSDRVIANKLDFYVRTWSFISPQPVNIDNNIKQLVMKDRSQLNNPLGQQFTSLKSALDKNSSNNCNERKLYVSRRDPILIHLLTSHLQLLTFWYCLQFREPRIYWPKENTVSTVFLIRSHLQTLSISPVDAPFRVLI